MNNLPQLLREIREEIGADFVSTSIVDMDGMTIAENSASTKFNTDAASARFAMVMKLGTKMSSNLSLGPVVDNLVVTNHVFALSRFLGDGSYYWNLFITKEATLGYARLVMNEYADKLWSAIPQ